MEAHLTSLNHNTALGNVEVGLHNAGVPYKSTGSTNGRGTKGAFRQQFSEHLSGSSIKGTHKMKPVHVIMSTATAAMFLPQPLADMGVLPLPSASS